MKRTDFAQKAQACGRLLMSRRGNVTKIVLAFLFSVTCAVLVMMACDAVCVYFVSKRFESAATVLSLAAALTVYAMADVMLLRLGIRAQVSRIDLFDFGKKGKGSGLGASVAAGLGFLIQAAALTFFYAYVEVFSLYVSRVLGPAIHGLCTLLTAFLVCVIVFYMGTGVFFLGAVAERGKKGVFGLLIASQRAARGNRLKVVKFVLSFALLTFLSLFSLGILFFVYVLPLYILSYGAFVSEVLDNKEC